VPLTAPIPQPPRPTAAEDAQSATNTPDEDDDPQQRGGGRGGAATGATSTTKPLTFEYDLSTSKLTLLDEKSPAKAFNRRFLIRQPVVAKYLPGDFDRSVDMWELNREKPQDNKTPGAPKQVITTLKATTTDGKTAEK
jgi:hypothetical protein